MKVTAKRGSDLSPTLHRYDGAQITSIRPAGHPFNVSVAVIKSGWKNNYKYFPKIDPDVLATG